MLNLVKMMLFIILLPTIRTDVRKRTGYKKEGQKSMLKNKTTSCEEFGKNARFDPYSVANVEWFVFYYWSSPKPPMSYKFKPLTKRDIPQLHMILDEHVTHFNWSVNMVLMEGPAKGNFLLAEKGPRGHYWMYLLVPDLVRGVMLPKHEVRLKQIGDKYVGAMDCMSRSAAIMSRITEVPPKSKLRDEATKLQYRGKKGKSYLFQQRQEGKPISELDEKIFWENWTRNN